MGKAERKWERENNVCRSLAAGVDAAALSLVPIILVVFGQNAANPRFGRVDFVGLVIFVPMFLFGLLVAVVAYRSLRELKEGEGE